MPKTLLLADDSVTIQKVVGISFASEDVELVTVDNGDDAIARAREIRPDLVLADVVMPGKNGYEVCEAINADPDLRHIPVLLLTGTFEAFDEQRANAAGAAGQVAKPFEAQTLVDQVKTLLASPPPAAAVAPAAELAGGAPVAMPAPLPPPPTVNPDNSFDFFDGAPAAAPVGGLGNEAAPAVPQPDGDATVIDDMGALDVGNDEFSFGDDSFEILTSDVGHPGPGATAPPSGAPPVTPDPVANDPAFDGAGYSAPGAPAAESGPDPLLADLALDPVAPVGEPDQDPGDLTQFAPDLLEPQFTAEHEVPAAVEPTPAVPAPEAEPAATQLFDIGGTVEPEPMPGFDAAGPSGQLADAAVLDPNGASGFDVSSSDLGPPLTLDTEPPMADFSSGSGHPEFGANADTGDGFDVIDAASVAPAEPDLLPPPLPEPPSAPSAVGGSDVDFGLGQPLDPATPRPADAGSEFGELPAAPPPIPAPVEVAPAVPPPLPVPTAALEPAPEPAVARESYAPSAVPDAPQSDARYEAGTPTPSTEATEDLAAAAVASAMPQLEAQIHDTLEKVAWESFGNLTEEIVKQALERVEAIAWEVVPRMAETLIQEEIRKLKGGGSDESGSGV